MFKYPLMLCGLLAVLTTSCKKESDILKTTSDNPYCIPEALKSELQLETIKKRKIEETLTLTGTIQYNEDKTVPFISLLDGVVTNTYFALGDYVKKGQLLAELKSTSLNEMHDQVSSLKSQIQVAQRQLNTTQSLFNDGLASQKELVEAQSELTILQSNLSALNSNMSLYHADTAKSVFQIKAPTEGYIVAKNINTGMSIQAGEDPLFIIADLSEVWIMANIYASYAPLVQVNQSVKVKTLAYPNTQFEGKIAYVSQIFDEQERVLKARIVMPNQQAQLKPGMSADIILSLDSSEEEALAIPMNAVIFDNNQNYAIVYKSPCEQEIRRIENSSKNGQYMYVKDHFKENETVITTNELLIYEELTSRKK